MAPFALDVVQHRVGRQVFDFSSRIFIAQNFDQAVVKFLKLLL